MITPYYAILYTKLNRIAYRYGWNIALHGSMLRDLDLVLIPWTEDAEHEDKVIDAIRLFIEGQYTERERKKVNKKYGASQKDGVERYHVTEKPHGRRAISIYIGVSSYCLDISIMPLVTK